MNNFLKTWSLVLMVVIAFVSANSIAGAEEKGKSKEILVSAAMSLKDVMTKMSEEFQKRSDPAKISFNFASSGQLKAQIEAGAPVDVFISAAMADVDALIEKGLILKESKKVIASNSLVLITHKSSKIPVASLMDITKMDVRKIAIGNPVTVPAGRYAKEAMEHFKIYDQVKGKLVFTENVRQVLDYVSRNEVEAGVVFLTDSITDQNVKNLFSIPQNAHKTIAYPAVIIKASANSELAKKFLDYITSDAGQKILIQYGFVISPQ